MPDAFIYAGNWGHTHTITVQDEDGSVVDLSSATELGLRFQRERGTAIEVEATLVTDGADGQLRYAVTEADTVDAEAGTWRRWAVVTFSDGEYASTPELYSVKEPGR